MPSLRRGPRRIPLSTRLVVVFGGGFAFFGWFFFAFGMVFVWVFAGNADWSSVVYFHGPMQRTPGQVTGSLETGFSQGGGKHRRGTPIYAMEYRFNLHGANYEGTSYQHGGGKSAGDAVSVEFPVGRPEVSRIVGTRRAPFSMAAAFVFIFPAIGLATVLPGIWRGMRGLRLLAHGEPVRGRLVRKEPTSVKLNKLPVYKLVFQFTDALGQVREVTTKTHQTQRLEDDAAEQIFYDPQNPDQAVLLDSLPGRRYLGERGEMRPAGFGAALRVMLLPLVALAVVAVGCWWKLLW